MHVSFKENVKIFTLDSKTNAVDVFEKLDEMIQFNEYGLLVEVTPSMWKVVQR